MKDTYFTLIKNERIAANTYLSVLKGDTSDITASGQFVNIKLDGFYLRRPISVCNVEGDELTIIYKAVGAGTEKMASTEVGTEWLIVEQDQPNGGRTRMECAAVSAENLKKYLA